MNPFDQAGFFLVHLIFDLYLFALLFRLLLQFCGANFYNPICQFILKVTQPVIKPFQRFLPNYKGLDLAVLAVLLIIEVVKLYLLAALQAATVANPVGVLVWMAGDLAKLLVNLYFYAILIRVVLSWVSAVMITPTYIIVTLITEPLLAPARRVLPPMGGFDLSPLIVLVLLELISILVVAPLSAFGYGLAI